MLYSNKRDGKNIIHYETILGLPT